MKQNFSNFYIDNSNKVAFEIIKSGADIRSVSGRLGHSNTSTTLNIYSHFIQSRNREIADKLQQMLG